VLNFTAWLAFQALPPGFNCQKGDSGILHMIFKQKYWLNQASSPFLVRKMHAFIDLLENWENLKHPYLSQLL